MSKNKFKLLFICLFCCMLFVSCERYPVSALLGIHDVIDSWPNPWYVYDDEINTKGLLEPYRWKDNPDGTINHSCAEWSKVSLSFACSHGAKVGNKCISFTWVGNNGDPGKYFFGFGLQAREQLGGKINLGNAGYTVMKFWAKGNLYSGCNFEIKIPNDVSPNDSIVCCFVPNNEVPVGSNKYKIESDWKEYEVRMDGVGEISFVLSMSLYSTGGTTNGGTVYIDDIRFIKE